MIIFLSLTRTTTTTTLIIIDLEMCPVEYHNSEYEDNNLNDLEPYVKLQVILYHFLFVLEVLSLFYMSTVCSIRALT